MIPKIIHCCWFGGTQIPQSVSRYIANWQSKLPDYQLMVWTEKEFDITKAPIYVQQAYECKKFAFVSDYVRLYALHKYGGVYMDTDVEVVKSLDSFLHHSALIGFECEDRLSTAFIASISGALWIGELMDEYESRVFVKDGRMDLTTNVEYVTRYFKQHGLQVGGEKQTVGDVEVFPSEYFSPKSWNTGKYNITDNTVVIHHFSGTWHSPLTQFLSVFFSNNTIVKIASLKERVVKMLKNVRSKN